MNSICTSATILQNRLLQAVRVIIKALTNYLGKIENNIVYNVNKLYLHTHKAITL